MTEPSSWPEGEGEMAERFRMLAESIEDVFYMTDLERGQLEYLSPSYETVWGRPVAELMADLSIFATTIHPDDRGGYDGNKEAQLRGERVASEYRIVRPDGSVRWIYDRSFPVAGTRRSAGIATDITARKLAEAALRESEERYRLIVENARDYAIFTTDPDGRINQWFGGAASIFGWSADQIVGQKIDITFTDEDRIKGAPGWELETARQVGRAPNVRWHLRKDGSLVFIEGITTALRDTGGALLDFLKIGQDVSGRKQAEEHQRTLLAELQHRVRNTLGIVRSIARRTAASSANVEEMATHLDGRLGAFSRVQTMATRNADSSVNLIALIEDELLAHAAREGETLTIKGPDVRLQPRPAETMSLAIHELAANAVKYGALSAGYGRVSICWNRSRRDGAEWLDLVWEENGLDLPHSEPERRGFGMELLTRTLPYDLRAVTKVEFRHEGLRFSLSVPLGPDLLAE